MITIKNDGKEGTDAKVKGMQPEILLAIIIVDSVLRKLYQRDLTLTSITDSHKPPSLHPKGQAFDMRTWGITPKEKLRFKKELKNLLGDEYDVVIEKDHIHIEFDPKLDPKEVEFDPSTDAKLTSEETQALLETVYEEKTEKTEKKRRSGGGRRLGEVGVGEEKMGEDESEEITRLKSIEITVREILRLVEKGEGEK